MHPSSTRLMTLPDLPANAVTPNDFCSACSKVICNRVDEEYGKGRGGIYLCPPPAKIYFMGGEKAMGSNLIQFRFVTTKLRQLHNYCVAVQRYH